MAKTGATSIAFRRGAIARNTGALSGAVSSYAALGPEAFGVEADFTAELDLGEPWPMDWKGSRDMFAEYASLLAIVAQTWDKIAQELFLLQGDGRSRDRGADGRNRFVDDAAQDQSAAQPHGDGASTRRAARAGVLLDWMVTIHERDQISSSDALGTISNALDRLLAAAQRMLTGLVVNVDAMRANLGRTRGLIMAERAMFLLAPAIGKHTAHHEVRLAAADAWENGTSLGDELRRRPAIAAAGDCLAILDQLDPTAYTGLAPESVDRAIAFIRSRRSGTSAIP